MRILALVTDAFGGWGGIARYNRDFLAAACACDGVERVVCLPRLAAEEPEAMPPNLVFERRAARGPVAYLGAAVGTGADRCGWGLIYCSHINLVPIAACLGAAVNSA